MEPVVAAKTVDQPRPVLELVDARISRQKGGFTFDLHVPHLFVRPGEFVVLLGPNGCGKSTCLDLLALILKPDESASFTFSSKNGDVVDLQKAGPSTKASIRRHHLGYIMQSGGLLTFLSLRSNVLLPSVFCGGPNVVRTGRLASLMNKLGIVEHCRKKPATVSGGQRQRAAIARALIHGPSLVLADEPTASVDRPSALEIVSLLKELCKSEGAAVVMVTHDVSLIQNVAHRCYVFDVVRDGDARVQAKCLEYQAR